ncbi:MAG: HEAT repeat domain-containing protein [Candidatus Lokiarchaeota archaeon]|nr:HEAT repeat domain-containing protein [Candidatus Lokiarchaeota archaeon]
MSAPLENLLRDARLDLIMQRIENDSTVIGEVITQLDSTIRSVRFNAILILGKLGAQASSALAKLTACLEDNDFGICRETIKSIGSMGNIAESAVSGLCKHMTHKQAAIRREVAVSLGNIGYASDMALSTLLSALNDPVEEVRKEAAEALGKIKSSSTQVLEGLATSLSDNNWRVRASTATSLGLINSTDYDTIGRLIFRFEDSDWRVRAKIIDALISFGERAVPQLLDALKSKKFLVRKAVIEAIGEIKPQSNDAIDSLAPFLIHRKEVLRVKSIDSLCNIGILSIPKLLWALTKSSNKKRAVIISYIGGIKVSLKDIIPDIVKTLGELNVLSTRILVAKKPAGKMTFGKKVGFAWRRMWSSVKAALTEAGKTTVRVELCRTLGKIGKDSTLAINVLSEKLLDNKDIVRRSAALSLGNLGKESINAVPNLVELCQDHKADVRWRASEALGRIGEGTPQVISALEELLYDKADHVSAQAEFSLEQIKEIQS